MKGGTGATQNLECDSGPANGCDQMLTEGELTICKEVTDLGTCLSKNKKTCEADRTMGGLGCPVGGSNLCGLG